MTLLAKINIRKLVCFVICKSFSKGASIFLDLWRGMGFPGFCLFTIWVHKQTPNLEMLSHLKKTKSHNFLECLEAIMRVRSPLSIYMSRVIVFKVFPCFYFNLIVCRSRNSMLLITICRVDFILFLTLDIPFVSHFKLNNEGLYKIGLFVSSTLLNI